jgi:SPP1 family predicted phage head-tail adaptor
MTRSVDSGRLRHRVTFETLPADLIERDTDGEIVETWVPVFNAPQPAEITPLSGRELIAANAQQSKVSHRIKVRYRVELTARDALRAIHRGTVYSVEAVIPDPDSGRRYQTLLCSSGVR